MIDLQGIQSFIESVTEFYETFVETVTPYVEWLQTNWLTLVLTGEIVGAVVAVKMGRYKRGFGWLAAALATIWLGGTA
ncbi:hypothetical protein TALC_00847 [Thermoplasmatales archaeon BRNA1]|nr:hypothetical protein TALC_00847 [Thermoplasmatales archaeon BRNA1]